MENLKVMLIEDNEEHVRIIRRYLDRIDGCNLTTDTEGQLNSGLKKLVREKYDAVLLDLRLPDSDINETLTKTLMTIPDVPIVVLSSLEDRELALRTVHEGAQDYICKLNMSSEILIRSIKNAIERKQNETRLRQQLTQSSALFEVSRYALAGHDVASILQMIEGTLERALRMDYVKIFDYNSETLLNLGLSVPVSEMPGEIWITDLEENYTSEPAFLVRQGLKSGINVIFSGKDSHERKLLVAYSKQKATFRPEDLSFLLAASNSLSAAIIRLRLEAELTRRIRDLDDADRRKDEFLATLSHELRTPLNVINNSLEILRTMESENPKEYEEIMEVIERNLKIEIRLVSEILDLSRVITGKMKFQPTKFNFTNLVKSTLESLKGAAQAKNLTITTDLSEEVAVVFGDEDRLQQVLWNLASNAVKFTPKGGEISIRARRVGSTFELSVKDSGIGLAPESLEHVFERFWQEDSPINRRFTGLGLGLGIVRHIVELHGGAVRVFSAGKGKGAEFVVSLPFLEKISPQYKEEMPREPVIYEKKMTLYTNDHGLDGLHILLVDDSEDSLVLTRRLLEKKGAEVQGISSPLDALRAAKEGGFDVLISDIGMPDMDGYELLRHLRNWESEAHKRPLPAIALTAYVSDEDLNKALNAGYQAHVGKPMKIANLEKIIVDITGKYREASAII